MKTKITTQVLESRQISDNRHGYRQLGYRSRRGVLVAVLFLLVVVLGPIEKAGAAQTEREVGVAAAATTQAVGIPPVSAERVLNPGVKILLDEQVRTDASGRLQILFLDGTALTLGADSGLVIDEYFYDPESNQGGMSINLTTGLFRVIGGKISKNQEIKFNTPTSKITIRGGMIDLDVRPDQDIVHFIHGISTTVKALGRQQTINQAGYSVTVTKGEAPGTPQRSKAKDLAKLADQLEGTAKKKKATKKKAAKKEKAAKKKAATESAGPTQQKEKQRADEQKQGAKKEKVKKNLKAKKEKPKAKKKAAAKKKKVAAKKKKVAAKKKATKKKPAAKKKKPAAKKKKAAAKKKKAAAKKKKAAAKKKKAAAKKKKVAAKKKKSAAKKKKAAAKKAAAEARKVAAAAKKAEEATDDCEGEEKPASCEEEVVVSRAGVSSGFTGGVVIERAGLLQVADQAVLLEGLELCSNCRFLEWGYFTEQIPTAMNSLRMGFWVNGIAATSKQLSAAATKQARYSGGLLGMVWEGNKPRTAQGDFRSTVSFGVANYNVDAFSATFDGGQYSSATPRGVKNGSAFQITDAASGRAFTASGYLFGTPQAVGQPPPEMAGQFSVTGSNYQAGGVFGGAMVGQSGNGQSGNDL